LALSLTPPVFIVTAPDETSKCKLLNDAAPFAEVDASVIDMAPEETTIGAVPVAESGPVNVNTPVELLYHKEPSPPGCNTLIASNTSESKCVPTLSTLDFK
jgi:hypothetical protein